MDLTILEGSTFCVCDEIGDFSADTHGFFADDTRFLSRFELSVNGARPYLLSSGKVEYFSAAFYMRNPIAGGLDLDQLSIERRRFIGGGMQDRVVVQNVSMTRLELELSLEFDTDFADIISVKEHDFSLGDPTRAEPLPEPVGGHFTEEGNWFLLEDPTDPDIQTQILLSQRGEVRNSSVHFKIALDPRARWELSVDVFPSLENEELAPKLAERRFGEELSRVRESLAAWQLRVPNIRATWDDLRESFRQSVADLASLRMRSAGEGGLGRLPAAGMPWFMTVFGRDTVITCLQTLLFGPELARGALEVLAELQSKEDDPSIDAEPGKIVHEVRQGKCARNWFPAYYGTVDATPLYLILLSEVWRWTDDHALGRRLRQPALRALEWIDRYGRTRGTRSGSRTAASPTRRSRRARCRATSTTRSDACPSSPGTSGATASWPSGSTARPTS